jgi:hypothetical protein
VIDQSPSSLHFTDGLNDRKHACPQCCESNDSYTAWAGSRADQDTEDHVCRSRSPEAAGASFYVYKTVLSSYVK